VTTPKRQHFIPCLYLKHFVGPAPKGQVWTYDAQAGAVRSAIPEETAVETHFYSVENPDGTMDTRIEEALASAESHASLVYEALLRKEIPKASQARADFSMFLALMYARTPAMRRMYAEGYSQLLQCRLYANGNDSRAFNTLIQHYEIEEGLVLDTEQKEQLRKAMLDPSGYRIEVPKERTLAVLGVATALEPILFQMTWSLVEPAHGFFITSDNPLVREVDYPETDHPIYGDYGFRNKTAKVIFPLSPQLLLFMSWNERAREFHVFEREEVDRVNRGLAAHSDRYLYAHIHHKRLQQLAAEFKNSKPKMGVHGFGPNKFAETKVQRRRHD
jgi:hypothetical protein